MTKTIRAGEGEYAGQDNKALQRAVDALSAEGGGVLEIPAGTYLLHDALHLRDNVRVEGETGTILKKVPSVSSPLTLYVGYGHYEFAVREPEKFAPGMGVLIQDDNAVGFYTTVASIVDRRGDLFFINRPFNHDYQPPANGTVASVFSLVEGVGVRDAGLKNVVLDGSWPEEETNYINGCRAGGIFLLESHRVQLEQVEIRNFYGDGISFQQCTDIWVLACHVHDIHGGGLHPGSGSVRYVMRNNRIEDNGGCGIFYCLRTTHSLCAENHIARNAKDGISVGERDSDHIIRYNVIEGNAEAGVVMRTPAAIGGDRTWLEGNRLSGNNTGGKYAEFYVAGGLTDVCLIRNRIEPAGGPAIFIEPGSSGLHVTENTVDGRAQTRDDVAGEAASVSFEEPNDFPPVGPQAAGDDAVWHLNLRELPPSLWGFNA